MTVTSPDVNLSAAREQLSTLVDQATTSHEPVFLARRGRRIAAIIDSTVLAGLIEAAEDMADIRAAEAARQEMADTQAEPIPWDEVKADLGLA
ncbi:MAG TPA: type II toxin-antitoxin system Phd/YefM family antitoxin [Jatrophihabitans sp.]